MNRRMRGTEGYKTDGTTMATATMKTQFSGRLGSSISAGCHGNKQECCNMAAWIAPQCNAHAIGWKASIRQICLADRWPAMQESSEPLLNDSIRWMEVPARPRPKSRFH